MQNPQLIGVVVSVVEGERIQLLDDKEHRHYTVRRLKMDGNIESDPKFYGYQAGGKQAALGLALRDFSERIRAEYSAVIDLATVEEFALILSPSGTPDMPDHHVFMGNGDDPAQSIASAEELAIAEGVFDIEALRDNADYSSAIAALLRSAEDIQHTGIALIIR